MESARPVGCPEPPLFDVESRPNAFAVLAFCAEITRLPGHCVARSVPENATAHTTPSRSTMVAHMWLFKPLVSAGLASVCGGILLTAYSVLSGEVGEAVWARDAILALGYLIVAGSLVGFTAYVWLLRSAPISLVSTYAYVNPIVAVLLARS